MASSMSTLPNRRKRLDVVVVGGSLAGLMTAILLKRQGHNVQVLESTLASVREGTAAGIGLSGPSLQFLSKHDRLKHIPLGIRNREMAIFEKDMQPVYTIPINYSMTTWEALYHRLRANFDAFRSPFCNEPPQPDPSEGKAEFKTATVVRLVEEQTEKLIVHAENVHTKVSEAYHADIIIATDGANSTVRRQFQPRVVVDEAGYFIWRGTVPVKRLSQAALDLLDGRTVVYRSGYSYTVTYPIPGPNGSLSDSDREINFVWYAWPPAGEQKKKTTIEAVLTDKSGHTHRRTLPKGQIREEIWTKQISLAKETLHPLIVEVMDQIDEPFVSTITSHVSTRAVFCQNRLFLLGDALMQPRPHTGFGVSAAAMTAMSLVEEIFTTTTGARSPEVWEKEVLWVMERERLRGVEFASRFLYGFVWRWVAWVRFQWFLKRETVWRWWWLRGGEGEGGGRNSDAQLRTVTRL